ncbi:MAG: PLP-dependent aminotransferase family protein [Firmicutes bacterium]|nr:PLP-dependent aminotransferase family protein [Bacillota bacterium]
MSLKIGDFIAKRAEQVKGSAIREFFSLTEQEDVISFAGGFPSADYFPLEQVKEILMENISATGYSFLQYGPTEGVGQLRSSILEYMQRLGVCGEESNLLVTSGSQQGIDLICKLLINPGDTVLVEEPGYVGALGAVKNYEGKLVGIPMDQKGIRTDILERYLQKIFKNNGKVKFIYLVPDFQNPTGISLSFERRRRLMELASHYDFLIVEDNPYGELRYEGEKLPLLKSMDEEQRVIYLGSFSKIFIPGIRVGWVLGFKELITKMISLKQSTDLCSNILGQYLVLGFYQGGHFEQHVKLLREKYRRKCRVMLKAMEHYFPSQIHWTKPKGGFFIWVTFPSYINAHELLLKCLKEKVAFVDGKGFFCGCRGDNTARFSFSEQTEEDIVIGIERIGQILEAEINSSRLTASR